MAAESSAVEPSADGARDSSDPDHSQAWKMRARLDAVFGEQLPQVSSDERREAGEGFSEDFWREQRPPHHD